MRFSMPEDFGRLVRPRVLTHVYLYPHFPNTEEPKPNANIDHWWKSVKDHYQYLSSLQKLQLTKAYDPDLSQLFSELKLGDTTSDLSSCYVAKITHFIVMFHGTYYLIDTEQKGRTFEERIRRIYGTNTKLRIYAVGLKFYRGMRNTEAGLEATEPWSYTEDSSKIWFYQPQHVVPVENIIRFEKVEEGDLVLFKESHGMAVSVTTLTKPKFYKTNSWSTKTIKLLSGTRFGFIRFLPDKRFTVKSKDRELEW